MNYIVIFAASSLSSSDGVLWKLFVFLMIILAGLVLWAMGKWLIPKFGAAPIVLDIWAALFVILGGVLLINLLLGFAGHGFIKW